MNLHLRQTNEGTPISRHISLMSGETEIGTTILELPADDNDVANAVQKLIDQAAQHDVRLRGSRKAGLFRAIAMGTPV